MNTLRWSRLLTVRWAQITLVTWVSTGVCRADYQDATPIESGIVYNSPDSSLENNFPNQLTLSSASSGRDSVSYLDVEESNAEAESAATLTKKTLNPVSNLISVPFQYNADFNIGPNGATRSLLNVQPVIPISISDDWNLIIRTIIPIIYIDSVADGVSSRVGLGDTIQSFFLSPRNTIGGWILGFGPVFLWPTATDDALGSGKFGAGPTGVALRQDGPWTYGALASQVWSYAGDSDRRSVSSMFLQPFVAYSFPTYTSIVLNTETTYDWQAHQTTIPINLAVTQILKIGSQPISLQVGPRYYAERAPGGAYWGLRFTFTLLFPK